MPQPVVPSGLRTFTMIWFGQLVSSLGSGLTGFGLGVYLFQETGSATQFALNSFFYVVPIGLVHVVAGAIADRWDRHKILILVDSGQALVTLGVIFLLHVDRLEVWHIYLLTIINAVLISFQGPTYEASVSLLVPKQYLGRAAGMARVSEAITRLITPTLAGFLVVTIGLYGVVLIDLITFLIAIISLLIVHIPNPETISKGEQAVRSLRQDIIYGWHYLLDRPGLLGLNLLSYIHDFFANSALVLTVPMILLLAGPNETGVVLATGGAGFLLGSLLMTIWGGPERRVKLYLNAIAFNGGALVLAGGSPHVVLIAIGYFLFYFGFSVYAICLRSILQRKVALEMQGRVFGAIAAISMLTEAPAYLIGGLAIDKIFEPLMAGGGLIAGVLGPIIGIGPGRGMGLWYIMMGVGLMTTALTGYLSPRICLLEDELPDAT